MRVYKSVITITVLSEDCATALGDVSDILRAIDDGDSIGSVTITSLNEEVPSGRVADELVAVGNDGSFFAGLN